MLIAGTWKTTKRIGQCLQLTCHKCGKTHLWELCTAYEFFTLYYIPVFPLQVRTYIDCPHCFCVVDPPQYLIKSLKAITSLHKKFQKGKISKYDYTDEIKKDYVDVTQQLEEVIAKREKARETSILCPFCDDIVHSEEGGLFIDRKCTKCSKELPQETIELVKAAYPEKF